MRFELITSPIRLAEVAASWPAEPVLAIDTEFVFERTYYPQLGLIQVAGRRGIWLLDPLALGDLAPLAAALRAAPLRTLHAAQGDLHALACAGVELTEPLLDTQIAAALAGLGGGFSYQRLVAALLGIELGKHATRSDWLARPLSEPQLAYAAEDVGHLVAVSAELQAGLERSGRLSWALEESARLLATVEDPDPEEAWRRVGGLEQLPPSARAAGRALAAWREREAARRDLPRRWVLSDDALLRVARLDPEAAGVPATIEGVPPRQLARDGPVWVELLRQANAADEVPPPALRLEPRDQQTIDRLARLVRQRAAELALPAELLAPRRLLTALVRFRREGRSDLPAGLRGWREEVIGRDLAALLD